MRPPTLFMLRGNVWLEVQGAEPLALNRLLAEAGLAFWDAEPEDDLTLRLAEDQGPPRRRRALRRAASAP